MYYNRMLKLLPVVLALGAGSLGNTFAIGRDIVKPQSTIIQAEPFDLSQVRLLDGPFKKAMLADKKYLLSIDPDRFLHMFRVTAGIPSNAKPFGGWESPNCELRGHSMGHYLSGCALMYASTGDKALKAKTDYIVAELAKCQEKMPSQGYNKGYLSAFPESLMDKVDKGEPVWAPWYTIHKIMAGVLDVYTYTGNKQALEVVKKMGDWVDFRTGRLSYEQMQKSLNMEYGGMGEVMANIYAVTADKKYLAVAQRFDKKWFFDPLEKREDHLRGLHANTHIPQVIAAAREYEMTGDLRYSKIASFFWDQIVNHRSLCTGGTSNWEGWHDDPDKLVSQLGVESQETCCTYNMLKLTKHMFTWGPGPQAGDYYERANINSILSTIYPDNGMCMYYVSMKPGHYKIFGKPDTSFWCCTGTGMENHAKYGDSIYYHTGKYLFIDQWIASELNWAEKGVKIKQETQFPESDTIKITFTTEKPTGIALKYRVPYWTSHFSVKLNGKPVKLDDPYGPSYSMIARTWKTGDTLEIKFPMRLHLAPLPDDESQAAIMYGPMVLAGKLGTEKLTKEDQFCDDQRQHHSWPGIDVPVLVWNGDDVNTWVKPVPGKPLTFTTVGVGKPNEITLVPLHKLFDERYSVYWKMYTKSEYESIVKERKEQEIRDAADRKVLNERSIDNVVIGDPTSESAHGLKFEGSNSGAYNGRNWRDAKNGWFSWDMKVDPTRSLVLRCDYWGKDFDRKFDILIDGQKIADENLTGNSGETFFWREYKIPSELIKGKDKVTIRFQSNPDSIAGGVFGVAVLRDSAK